LRGRSACLTLPHSQFWLIREANMKCQDCFGLGYVTEMRSMVPGRKIEPLPACKPCNGTGIIPDPKPVPFKSKLVAARRKRRP
jgi:DnaJ-class molecular chaperone